MLPLAASAVEKDLETEQATALSRAWRTGSGRCLEERRAVIGLSSIALGAMALIALYQVGLLKHLPEPPLPTFDADRVDASTDAYKRFSAPDAVLGVGSYAVTMALAAMGGRNRATSQPWIPIAMAAKVGFDVAQGVRLTFVQRSKFRAFCFWSLLTATASFASAPLVVRETRDALRQFTGTAP